MFELLLKILSDEQEYFNVEESKALIFLKRGRVGLERQKMDFWYWCVRACKMELDYIREGVKNLQMEYYAMTIKCKTEESNGKKWTHYWTIQKFLVKGEENKGYQHKTITIKFDKSIDTSKLTNGFLIVHKSNIIKPKIYEIKEENGKKIYPFLFVKEIYCFEANDEIFGD